MGITNTTYRATAWVALVVAMVASTISVAVAETPEACCIPDETECQYLAPQECSAQGGNSLGPGTDCAMGFCCSKRTHVGVPGSSHAVSAVRRCQIALIPQERPGTRT